MKYKYIALPNPIFGYGHLLEATKLVDTAFANGYFRSHLEEIECAWVALELGENIRVVPDDTLLQSIEVLFRRANAVRLT